MMSLADLLAEIELRGRTWCYSDIGSNNCVSVPPLRSLVVHIAIHGSVKLTCAGGGAITLSPGEAAFILRGDGHALRTGQGREAASHPFLRTERPVDMPETVPFGRSGAGGARILSARLGVAWPATIEAANLPRVLKATGAGPAAAVLPALPTLATGSGSTALLTKAAELILVAELGTNPDFTRRIEPEHTDPIERAMMMLRADPAATWSVERLAKAVGMCRSSFAEQFTRQVGRPPMEALTTQRMEFAAVLLREGKLTIREISESAGYASEAAFSRRFSRHYGVSPKQMRERAAARAVPVPITVPSPGRLFRMLPAAAPSYCSEAQAVGSAVTDRPTLLFRAAGGLYRAGASRQ